MPVAFFEMKLNNPTSLPIKLAAMFTFPNAPAFATGSIRTGFYNKVDFDAATGITGITLGSDAPTNSANAIKSEWTIATQQVAGQTVSYCNSWNGAGDDTDIYSAFSTSGVLSNAPTEATPTSTAGAIAVSLTLQPGQTQTVRFALAWDFPQQVYNSTI